jgi:PAS domain S-box-containing protein
MASGAHSLVFSTREPAYAVDRNGRIVAWNPAASETFGYSGAAALGGKCWELLQGRDAFDNEYCGKECPIRRMALEHRSVNRCRMTFRTASGERRAFTLTTLVLFNNGEATLIHLCRKVAHASADSPLESLAGKPKHAVLTLREREVVHQLADGHSTREIATLLGISVSTVRSHVEHILRKLNAHSRLEAVAISRRLGLD